MNNRLELHFQNDWNLRLGGEENKKIKKMELQFQCLTTTYQNITAICSEFKIESDGKNSNLFWSEILTNEKINKGAWNGEIGYSGIKKPWNEKLWTFHAYSSYKPTKSDSKFSSKTS